MPFATPRMRARAAMLGCFAAVVFGLPCLQTLAAQPAASQALQKPAPLGARAAGLDAVAGRDGAGGQRARGGSDPPIVVRDDRGVAVSFSTRPRRVVSLLPSLTEAVCALGACERLVGTDRYSDFPDSVQALPKLGGLDDAQIERIVALMPDVVLVSSAARVIGSLEALGLRVMVLETRDRADLHRTLDVLAQLFDVPLSGQRVWARIERETADAAARVPVAMKGQRVYFELDATPYAAGPASFIGQTLAALGLANVIPGALGAYPRLNPEAVVRFQPDLVMADRRSLVDMPSRPGWHGLRALREHRTCGFDARGYELLVRPGPRLGEGAALIAACLVEVAKAHP